jgi:hypothetical protein
MSEALLLPAAVAFLGALVVVWWERPKPPAWARGAASGAPGAQAGGAQAGQPEAIGATAPTHGAHAAPVPVDAVPHGSHAADVAPATDAAPGEEPPHGVHAAPVAD